MNVKNASDLYDAASDLADRPRQFVSGLDVPDFDLSDATDSVVDRAGDVVAVVGTEGRRGAQVVVRAVRRNPKISIGVALVVGALVAYLAFRRSSDDADRLND